MASLDLLVKALDTAHWEMGEAFKGLPDADVWRRPDPRLLSVGELAAHVAYGEAQWLLGEAGMESPLVNAAVHYYTTNVERPFKVPMGADELLREVQRVHSVCRKVFSEDPPDSEALCPHREGATWGFVLEYSAFHVAYHTGQIYSVRHLLGHETVDN